MAKLALQNRKRRKISVEYKTADIERYLALAERYGEDLAVVIRACGLKGLDHFEEWASNGAVRSPFEAGLWNQRPPSHYDPVGNQIPPVPRQPPFVDPRFTGIGPPAPAHPQHILHQQQYVEESTETAWGDEGVIPGLPSGASQEVVKGGVRPAPPTSPAYRRMQQPAPTPPPAQELLAPEPAKTLAVGDLEPAPPIEGDGVEYEMGQPTVTA